MNEGGVLFNIASLPLNGQYVSHEELRNLPNHFFVRPTIPFKLECEEDLMQSRTKAITAAEEAQFSFKKSQAGTLYGIGLALSISTGILTCVSLNLIIVSKASGAMPCVILNICQAMILTAILTAFG